MNPIHEPYIKINRIKFAFGVALAAGFFEFPITWFEHFGWEWVRLIGQAGGLMLDCAVMGIMIKVLGFNWAFVPGFIVEVVPTLDLFPSWVAAVAFVVWQRKKAQQITEGQSPSLRPLIDVQEVKNIGASFVSRLALPAQTKTPEPTFTPAEADVEQRLQHLTDLHDKNFISQSEYEAKRRRMLDEL
jgi:hypothetical protein